MTVHRLYTANPAVTKLGDFDPTVQRSQKYLFHIDPTSDRLVDMRGRITVEHKLGSAQKNTQRFGYPDYPANATYNHLQPADVHLGDTWLMVGNVLKDPPPTPPRTLHVPAPSYRQIWGHTESPEADQEARFTSAIANNMAITSSDG